MRIVCISDTHNRHHKLFIPDGDCLVHCGDLSESGSGYEILSALKWMSTLPHKYKIWIAGNHDMDLDDFQEFEDYVIKKFPRLTYLKDSGTVIEGVKFYGVPWTRWYNNWGFGLSDDELEAKFLSIPDDTDVLVTHGPPEEVLDKTYNNTICGCRYLLDAVRRVQPKLHVFGHIHEDFGMKQIRGRGTIFVNASIQDYYKNTMNVPVIIEV